MKKAMKLAMNIICPFVWYETFGVNNFQVLSQIDDSFKFQFLPPLLSMIGNALIVKQGTRRKILENFGQNQKVIKE